MTPTGDRNNLLVTDPKNIPDKEFKTAGVFPCNENF